MNMQRRSDERSLALYKEIAKKLRRNSHLWDIPRKNIAMWKKQKGRLAPALMEWEELLNTKSREQIIAILESDSEESTRLRSSSPFAGILSEKERRAIFDLFRFDVYSQTF